MLSSRTALSVTVAAGLGAVGLVSVTSAAASPSSAAKGNTIHVIQSNAAVFSDVDVAPKGDSPGDYFVVTGPFVDPSTRAKVGTSNIICTLLKVAGGWAQCIGTAQLADGDITVQGIFKTETGKRNELAITGGTGAYRTARGTATATILRNGETDVVFKLAR